MPRILRFLAGLCVTLAVAWTVSKVPWALSHMELFRVTEVRLADSRYLSREAALEAAQVPEGASIWDDPGPYEERLRRHPLVRDVRVRRRIPGTLVLDVKENEPVGLLATPVLDPVDASGRLLPIDPAVHRLDLPVLQAYRGTGSKAPISPAELGILAGEASRLAAMDPEFLAAVSEIGLDAQGDITLWIGNPTILLRYRPPLTAQRLRDALVVHGDAIGRRPQARVRAIDLRFAEQVVVRYSKNGR